MAPPLICPWWPMGLITRATSRNDLGRELGRQLLFYPRALTILAGMMGVMALVPGLPTMPFLTLAVIVGMLSYTMHRYGGADLALAASPATGVAGAAGARTPSGKPGAPVSATAAEARASEQLENLLGLDTLQIELGYGLVSLADPQRGGDLRDE